MTNITGDSRETMYLFQQLSVDLQTGNRHGFVSERVHSWQVCSYLLFLASMFTTLPHVGIILIIIIKELHCTN